MDVETIVKKFIEENFLYKKGTKTLSGEDSLLDAGLIDSMGIFQLITFIETQFHVEVQDEDIVPENFETLNSIVALIDSKRKTEAG